MESQQLTPEQLEKMDVSQLQDALQQVNLKGGKNEEELFKKIMPYVTNKGIMPKVALKISDETMEAIYSQAYNLYNQGKYKESSYIFRFLMLLDMTTPKYILGLAACLHRLNDWINASNLYFLCSALDPQNPLPHFHATDCYLQLNQIYLALIAIQMAINTAGNQPQYNVLKERSQLLKASLIKKLEEEEKMLTEKAAKTGESQKK